MKRKSYYLKYNVSILAIYACACLYFNILAAIIFPGELNAQIYPANPANWLYPDGNPEGTKYIASVSKAQSIDSFNVKWISPYLFGNIKPLIGNIINNPQIMPSFKWGPNEIAAVIGGELVLLDANGKRHRKTALPSYIKDVSVLFDTLSTRINTSVSAPVILGLESIEFKNTEDSLAFGYIAGYDAKGDFVSILKRLALDLRGFPNNLSASVKPVLGRRTGSDYLVYATINMTKPDTTGLSAGQAPFFRGFAQFNTGTILSSFPLPDIGDDIESRVMLGQEINFSQPSYSASIGGNTLLLPSFPASSINAVINNSIIGLNRINNPYLYGINLGNIALTQSFTGYDLSSLIDTSRQKPQFRNYFINMRDNQTGDTAFILAAEEYRGMDGSDGISRLHLFDKDGNILTVPNSSTNPPIIGKQNHYWSVSEGNIDGISSNQWLPYYPNNPGKELVVTHSTRELTVPSSSLMVLRYNTGNPTPKASPPNSFLYQFDTIATQKISGWLAAVNDLDAAPDKKDEIILVDGSLLLILRMRNYNDYLFRSGIPFDTVYMLAFPNQTISSVAIADLEGDELNDLLVTTYDSTYLIGTALKNTLKVLNPNIQNQQTPPEEYCAGDTLRIEWRNIVLGQPRVNILFEPFANGSPQSDSIIVIESGYPNNKDTNYYLFRIDERVFNKEGRFIIRGASNPNIFDTTAVLKFTKPTVLSDPYQQSFYRVGDYIYFTGHTLCCDSVKVEMRLESDSLWTEILNSQTAFDGSYNLNWEVPCFNIFACLQPDADSLLNLRIIGSNSSFSDTTSVQTVGIKPAIIDITIDTSLAACPNIVFSWNFHDFRYPCDSIIFAISDKGTSSYSYVAAIPTIFGNYQWQVPVNLPDEVVVRLCCESACQRTDTLIYNAQPKFIDIVAPNPFKPPDEMLEVVYKVSEETNITIRILDQANRIVAEPVSSVSRLPGISYCDRWNGFNRDGKLAANGLYYLVLETSGGKREVYQIFVKK